MTTGKPSPNLELLVNQFNSATLENSNDPDKISPSKYYDIKGTYNIEMPHKNKLLPLFHINSCSLNKLSFLTVIWLYHSQPWAIVEGTASLTR